MSEVAAQAHISGQRRIREILVQTLTALWRALPSYNRRDVDLWLEGAVPLVNGAQQQSIALTQAYFAAVLVRDPIGLGAAKLTGAALRNGIPTDEVYRRAFVTTWTALKDHVPWEDAVTRGLERATSAAEMDVQLAMRKAVAEITKADPAIVGYRRVTDPGACTLCRIASTQRYRTGELMPIHNRCGCGVAVLTEDTGRIVDRELYQQLKSAGDIDRISAQRQASGFRDRARGNRERSAEWQAQADREPDPRRKRRLEHRALQYEARADAQDLSAKSITERRAAEREDARPTVAVHGELGPLLVQAGHEFTELAGAA